MKNYLLRSNFIVLKALVIYLIPLAVNGQICNGNFPSDFSYQQSACNPKGIQYATNLSNVKSYLWSFGNGQISSNANPLITYFRFDVYIVKLIVTYNNGCVETVTKIVPVTAESESLIITNDTSICRGDSVVLLTKANGFDSCWEASSSLSIKSKGNVVAKPLDPTSYIFNARKLGDNLVYNGDFSNGSTGFSSAYLYNKSSGLYEGYYTVANDPRAWHPAFISCGDHTTGTGNMLMVNGATQPNWKVWSQSMPVTPNSNYVFSTWLASVAESYPPNPASLQFSINGQLLGNPFTADLKPCAWQQFYSTWNSGNNTTATIQVVNMDTIAGGNDFGLDDIFFGQITLKTDTVKVSFKTAKVNNITVAICPGQSYKLPSGVVAKNQGPYIDTLTSSKCDTLITRLQLLINKPAFAIKAVEICAGNNYRLPSGRVVKTTGVYNDTLRYTNGCDSIITTVDVNVKTVNAQNISATICIGQTYTMVSGKVVKTTGVYQDTLRYTTGCDSLIVTVTLIVQPVYISNIVTSICEVQSYKMPTGFVVKTNGIYKDTIRYKTGCDSLITTVDLTVQKVLRKDTAVTICSGQGYVMPSRKSIKATGVYSDTLHYKSGCDSLITTIDLTVKTVSAQNVSSIICDGQTYTLPSGKVVKITGTYKDTLRYKMGCDSLITTVTLLVQRVYISNLTVSICEVQSYKMPTGFVVKTDGIYKDTLRYRTGCDSLITTVDLTVQKVLRKDTAVTICSGQTYVMPSGKTAKATGVYSDTLHYKSGCDSLITTIDLTVKTVSAQNVSSIICDGQTYTLPSGRVVKITGTYKDTLRYKMGCDSLITTVTLLVQRVYISNLAVTICEDQSYKMPTGFAVKTDGIYKDTLRYRTGCDSLITTVDLTVQKVLRKDTAVTICSGQTYVMPSGKTAKATGVYSDTLHYKSGCDSLITTIDLIVQKVYNSTLSAKICIGDFYTLPSGRVVNSAGVYKDTVRYVSGCDSLITLLNLTINTITLSSKNVSVCYGQIYALPSGLLISQPGIYKDTVRYSNGCDSLISSVNVLVEATASNKYSVALCAGQTYQLPSGKMISAAGIYSDTLRSKSGCDSLITAINLTVSIPKIINQLIKLCEGESYPLPWGGIITTAGIYRDTLKSTLNCDSLITVIRVAVKSRPVVKVTKSNDIYCSTAFATLSVSNAGKYTWLPASTLDNPQVQKPKASPSVTTVYKAQVTSIDGCMGEDSIEVKVLRGNVEGSFFVPAAFTPDSDGKNDYFGIKEWSSVTNLKFSVYNRWGILIFQTTNPSRCWDGTYKGVLQNSGAFVYQISADSPCGPVFRKGTVMLLR